MSKGNIRVVDQIRLKYSFYGKYALLSLIEHWLERY
jgi:hypothetical protein